MSNTNAVERENLSPVTLVKPIFVPYPEVVIKGDILYVDKTEKQTNKVIRKRVGRKLEIISENKFLEDETISYDLKIYTKAGVIIEKDVSRSILTSKEELLETVNKGSDVDNDNYKTYSKSLKNQEEALKAKLNHKGVGWDIYQGERIYKHKDITSNKKIESIYHGECLIETKGTLEEYKEFLEEEVIGHTPLEAAIALGLSSVVVGYLDNYKSNIFNIYGNSTTGKTTVGELIVSLASKPTMDADGLMMSWNTTQNALIGKIRDKNGIPMLIDDSSVSKIKDFTSLIYQLESGKDKERMNKEGDLRETRTWQTTMISTGESSLLENSNENEGLKVRLQEFADVVWTQSSDHSNRIKHKVQKVYGHGVKVVAKKLLEMSDEQIDELLENFEIIGRDYLTIQNKVNNLTDRILKIYATVRLAIEMFEQELELDFDMHKIERFLLHHMFMEQRQMWEIALERLLGYVESNINRFNRAVIYDRLSVTLEIEAKAYNEVLGKISDIEIITKVDETTGEEKRVVQREIAILEDEFYKILKDFGFTNPKGILKSLKNKDLLNTEIDRYTRTRKISDKGNQVKVVVIKTEVEYEETDDMRHAHYKKQKEEKEKKKEIIIPRIKKEADKVNSIVDELLEIDKDDNESTSRNINSKDIKTKLTESYDIDELLDNL